MRTMGEGSGDASGGVISGLVDYTAQTAAAVSLANDAANQAAASAAAAFKALATLQANILMGSLTPDQTAVLNIKYPVHVDRATTPAGFLLPWHNPAAVSAGIKAAANQLTLELQAGRISQSAYNSALAALTV